MNLESVLLPYQRAFVRDEAPLKIWVAARQIGKSTAVAFEAVSLAAARPGTAVLLVSASMRQSRELLGKVRFFLSCLNAGSPAVVSVRESAAEAELVNRSRVLSLPANPDTIRGFSGHIFLDEFAFHRDSSAIWAAVFPITTRGYRLRITSTPNGKQNRFHRIWAEGGPGWSRHQTSIDDAVAQGLNVDLERLRQGVPDPETWAQEYQCRFLDQSTAYLTYDQIGAVESESAGAPGGYAGGDCFLGGDLGRRRDLTVFWVLESMGDVLWTREVRVLTGATFAAQDRSLDALVKKYRVRRVCLDQSGLGERVVEEAKTRLGAGLVEGVLFTGPVKQDLASALKRRVEDKTVRVPADPDVREDLHRMRRTVTSAGNVRFDADRSSDGHADRFWALALAVHAADRPRSAPEILSGGLRTPGGLEAF